MGGTRIAGGGGGRQKIKGGTRGGDTTNKGRKQRIEEKKMGL